MLIRVTDLASCAQIYMSLGLYSCVALSFQGDFKVKVEVHSGSGMFLCAQGLLKVVEDYY